ncbi:MAG TPA: DUF177 domain-containing protein [Lachnospiraceae bacterium]|nr:DUF177 domain-containing protein [Lachnospiraceae bacterium]
MLVNLTDILSSENLVIHKMIEIELDSIDYLTEKFVLIEKEPLNLTLTNMGSKKVLIEGKIRLVLRMNCDRCLKDVNIVFDLALSRMVVAPGEEKADEDEEEQSFMDKYHLDVDELVYSEIMMNWPMKVLCAESCKGICKKCGNDLNDGDCGCDTFVPDPRMAVIKDIFKGNKEV